MAVVKLDEAKVANPSSVCFNQDSSFLVLKQDIQHKPTFHLRLIIFNEAPT